MSFEKEYLDVCNKYPKEVLEREQKIKDDASNHNRHASAETKKLITCMNDEITTMKLSMTGLQKDVTYIKEAQQVNNEQHREIIARFDSFISLAENKFVDQKDHADVISRINDVISDNKLETRFANKWTEKVLIWVGTIIGGSILLGLIYLVADVYVKLRK